MRAFVDTSAFYAVLDKSDINHNNAAKIWRGLLPGDALLMTTIYYVGPKKDVYETFRELLERWKGEL